MEATQTEEKEHDKLKAFRTHLIERYKAGDKAVKVSADSIPVQQVAKVNHVEVEKADTGKMQLLSGYKENAGDPAEKGYTVTTTLCNDETMRYVVLIPETESHEMKCAW